MNSTKQRVVAVALAALMIAGTGGIATAAEPVSNTESTDTTYTTVLDDGTTVPYNETKNKTHSFSADSENASLNIYQDDTKLGSWDNSSEKLELQETVSGTSYYNFTLDQDASDFDGLDAAPGENVSLTIERVNDSTADNPDTSNITFYFVNDENKTFAFIGSDGIETSEPGYYARAKAMGLSYISDDEDGNLTNPAKIEDTVDVNGNSQEDVSVRVLDTDAQDALGETYQDSSDADSISWMGIAMVDGTFVPVKAEDASSPDWYDEEENAYVNINEGGEGYTVENVGTLVDEDTESVDVVVLGNEQANMGQIWNTMTHYEASNTDAIMEAVTSGEKLGFSDQFDLEA